MRFVACCFALLCPHLMCVLCFDFCCVRFRSFYSFDCRRVCSVVCFACLFGLLVVCHVAMRVSLSLSLGCWLFCPCVGPFVCLIRCVLFLFRLFIGVFVVFRLCVVVCLPSLFVCSRVCLFGFFFVVSFFLSLSF